MTNEQFEQIERLSKKLWGDINNGHEYSMVTYTEFLGIVTEVWEKLQEEPVSEDLEEEVDNYVKINGYDGLDSIEEVKYIANHFAKWQETKDESTTEDLGEYINELSKQFPKVSFAKLSRIAVRVAKWQKEKDKLTWEDIEAIDQISTDVFKDGFDVITNDYYQEVLKRFKERKENGTGEG